ncbi:hypothetical protein BDZ91DRAFT_729741 [Kalaharituber pfeilii]|nr:hypothetical protein BDZ91DRAFT_729741 [Kalaharituber pfeilii]
MFSSLALRLRCPIGHGDMRHLLTLKLSLASLLACSTPPKTSPLNFATRTPTIAGGAICIRHACHALGLTSARLLVILTACP